MHLSMASAIVDHVDDNGAVIVPARSIVWVDNAVGRTTLPAWKWAKLGRRLSPTK
jgi:hypothetical protein